MSSIDNTLLGGGLQAYKDIQLCDDHELSEVIKQHALLGTAAGMIPIPGADLAALVANTWTMYVRINNVVGVSFGDNVLKSIASGVIANLASLIPGIALAVGAGTLLKFIPGIGTVGGMVIGAAANVAIMYVAGMVYVKSLEVLIHSDQPLTEKNVKRMTEQISKDKEFVESAYAEGKEVAKAQ